MSEIITIVILAVIVVGLFLLRIGLPMFLLLSAKQLVNR